jgi:arylformamidase
LTLRVHDISVPIGPGLPTWPGSVGYRLIQAMSLAGGGTANVTRLDMDVHTGTHVEAPLHFLADGAALDTVALERFVGPAVVAAVDGPEVTAESLAALPLPKRVERLLLKTRNSGSWPTSGRFDPSYAALTADAASWLVERGVQLVGVDYLSVQRYSDDGETHRILMRADVLIVEGLNLVDVEPGEYTLICLPLRLVGTEAAPVRAVLLEVAP